MKLRTLSPEELAGVYQHHLSSAFPPAELKPLGAMEAMRERAAARNADIEQAVRAVMDSASLDKMLS